MGVLAPEAPVARKVKNLAFKTADTATADVVEVRADEGVVTAIVSVTGIVDDVDDIVLPGAYTDTLAKRRPKVCWHHAWEQPIGRVLHIEELLPGDKRLPAKTPDGKAWPREAGALVAAMQFNLDSQTGREAFSAVRFYSETGECEWSIGYRVPPGKSVKDKAGRRLIRALELFELSFVLFGCNDETGTLSVKQAVALMLERKSTGQVQASDDDVAELHTAAADEIDWAEVDEAALTAPADDDGGCRSCGEKRNGSKVLAAALEAKAEGGADRNRGGAENLRRWYVHGGGAALIEWGVPGDFMRCVAIAGKHMTTERAKGYCQLRHHDALGVYAGQEGPHGKALSAAAQPGGEAQTGVMVAVYPAPDVADQLAVADGDPPAQLHVTLAFLGDTDDTLPDGTALGDAADRIKAAVAPVAAANGPLTGIVGGIGQFPAGPDGTPVWAPVDVPGLSALREQVVDALAAAEIPVRSDHGFTPHMTLGYDLPDLPAVPVLDLTFPAVTVSVGDDAHPLPLGAPAEQKATAYSPALDIDRSTPPMPTQTKSFPTLAGSYQERMQAVEQAVTEALLDDVPRNDDGQPVGYYVSVVGTYDDRVIATLCHWEGVDERSDYEFPYSIDADNVVVLGDPVDVTLSVSVEVDDPADAGEAFGDMLPIAELLDTLTAGAEKMLVAKMETKAGRVLSAANESRLQAAVESLLKVLAAAGVHIGEPETPSTPAANVTTPESTAPAAQDVKTVDAAELDKLLAGLETA